MDAHACAKTIVNSSGRYSGRTEQMPSIIHLDRSVPWKVIDYVSPQCSARAPMRSVSDIRLALRLTGPRPLASRGVVVPRVGGSARLHIKVVPAWSRAAYLPSGVNSWPARPSTEECPQFLRSRAGLRPSQPPASKSAVPTHAALFRTYALTVVISCARCTVFTGHRASEGH